MIFDPFLTLGYVEDIKVFGPTLQHSALTLSPQTP